MEEMDLAKIIDRVKNEDLSATMLKRIAAFAKKSKSVELAYELACVAEGEIRLQMEKIILSQKDPMFCAKYATDIPGADVEKHKKIIFASKDLESICYFMNRVKPQEEDVQKAQKLIVESKDPKWAFEFADGVEESDKDLMAKVVINSKDEKYIKKFKQSIDTWAEMTNEEATRLFRKLNLAIGRHERAMRKSTATDELTK